MNATDSINNINSVDRETKQIYLGKRTVTVAGTDVVINEYCNVSDSYYEVEPGAVLNPSLARMLEALLSAKHRP